LNGTNGGQILQAFPQGIAQQVLAFFQDFGDGDFEKSLQTTFIDGSHKA
jgi:hypothetical protein